MLGNTQPADSVSWMPELTPDSGIVFATMRTDEPNSDSQDEGSVDILATLPVHGGSLRG